jgi:hypothetical protein
MKHENVQILTAKFGKIVEIDYFDRLDSRNHSIEDTEAVHQDCRRALMAFQDDLANAYYAISTTVRENFVPNEFSVTEKDGSFYLTIKGKFETSHEDQVNVTSGKILLSDDPTDELVVKLNTLRSELFQYFWNEKGDGKLPFKKEDSEEVQEENSIAEKE